MILLLVVLKMYLHFVSKLLLVKLTILKLKNFNSVVLVVLILKTLLKPLTSSLIMKMEPLLLLKVMLILMILT